MHWLLAALLWQPAFLAYGAPHCTTVQGLQQSEQVAMRSGPEAWGQFMRTQGRAVGCQVAEAQLPVVVHNAGPGGEPLRWEGREIICVQSLASLNEGGWPGCHYSTARWLR